MSLVSCALKTLGDGADRWWEEQELSERALRQLLPSGVGKFCLLAVYAAEEEELVGCLLLAGGFFPRVFLELLAA